jgi:hypothetical protein
MDIFTPDLAQMDVHYREGSDRIDACAKHGRLETADLWPFHFGRPASCATDHRTARHLWQSTSRLWRDRAPPVSDSFDPIGLNRQERIVEGLLEADDPFRAGQAPRDDEPTVKSKNRD